MNNIKFTEQALTKIQLETEYRYSKANVLNVVREDLLGCEIIKGKITDAIELHEEYRNNPEFEKAKRFRHSLITPVMIEDMICDMLVVLSTTNEVKSYAHMASVCASNIYGGEEELTYEEKIQTAAEIITLIAETDLVDIYSTKNSPVTIKVTLEDGNVITQRVMGVGSRVVLSDDVALLYRQTMHIPPMIVKPKHIAHNRDCGYLSLKKGVMLKSNWNYHDGDLCLDSINLFNSNTYSLDIDFLRIVEDSLKAGKKNKTGKVMKQQEEDFYKFKKQCNHVYLDIIKYGNTFYLTHHTDARGRTYAKGYHVNSQGKSFNKAMINWKEAKPIEIDEGTEDLFDLDF